MGALFSHRPSTSKGTYTLTKVIINDLMLLAEGTYVIPQCETIRAIRNAILKFAETRKVDVEMLVEQVWLTTDLTILLRKIASGVFSHQASYGRIIAYLAFVYKLLEHYKLQQISPPPGLPEVVALRFLSLGVLSFLEERGGYEALALHFEKTAVSLTDAYSTLLLSISLLIAEPKWIL